MAGPYKCAEKLQRLVDDGTISATQAELLAGHLLMGPVWEATDTGPAARSRRRRRSQLRELGITLADGVLDEVEVDVAEVLTAALETDVWERRG